MLVYGQSMARKRAYVEVYTDMPECEPFATGESTDNIYECFLISHLPFDTQLYQVADALEYLHNHDPKIIHGDIKGVCWTNPFHL